MQATEGEAAKGRDRPGGGYRPNGTNDPWKKTGMLAPLLTFLKTSLLLLVAGVFAAGCGFGGAGELTLGYLGWDENVANSNLTKVLLEDELGYHNVELKLADDVRPLYDDLIEGNTDAFLDAWMPNHQQFVDRGGIEVSKEPWYVGRTRYGIAVPKYMHDVRTIPDLNSSGTEMLTGIEPGAVLMTKIESDVVPQYDLRFALVEASTPAMLAELEQAYTMKEPFVFLAWSPHWMNQEYKFRYLSDPKNAMGGVDDPQRIHSVTREGLAGDEPAAYALINAMRLNEEQVGSIELAINRADDPEKGVRRWLGENRDLVRPWIEAAKNAQEG
ncbi:MAG TPA: glycine betaine ABC transporter substrate-binding protein [Rubrobacter sp.]|nr:glycine betaine ABC transporter substrate-binding protein [Rubrobacter sp.]